MRTISFSTATLALFLGGLAACGAGAPISPPSPLGANEVASDTAKPAESDAPGWGIVDAPPVAYSQVVHQVVDMVNDQKIGDAVTRRGLALQNLMWEDTGRSEGSSVGPNISDLTLEVRYRENGQNRADLLPVIRFPNFEDRTGDVPSDRFLVRVGNQKGGKLDTIPLTDVLKNVKAFVSDPSSIHGSGNLLAARNTALSRERGKPCSFRFRRKATPRIHARDLQLPVGAIIACRPHVARHAPRHERRGRDERRRFDVADRAWSRALLQQQRPARAVHGGAPNGRRHAHRRAGRAEDRRRQDGHREGRRRSLLDPSAASPCGTATPNDGSPRRCRRGAPGFAASAAGPPPPPAAAPAQPMEKAKKSDVEQAVLGHGKDEGKFEEGRGLGLERDPQFPIRVTVQFYKATSNGVVADKDLDGIAGAIGNVYEHADFVGSLVVPDGDPRRPTAWQKGQPAWFAF